MSFNRSPKNVFDISEHFQLAASSSSSDNKRPVWIYKKGTPDEVSIALSVCPRTSSDFYELAIALLYHSTYKGANVWLNAQHPTDIPVGSSEDDLTFFSMLRHQREIVEQHFHERVHQADIQFKADCQLIANESNSIGVDNITFRFAQAKNKELLSIRIAKNTREEQLFRMLGAEQVLNDFNLKSKKALPFDRHDDLNHSDSKQDFLKLNVRRNSAELSKRLMDAATKKQKFSYDLLIDAAIAGHPKAAEELEFVKLNNVDNIQISLVKHFKTADEFEKLAYDLKNNGGEGTYYFMENPNDAKKLSEKLFVIANGLRLANAASEFAAAAAASSMGLFGSSSSSVSAAVVEPVQEKSAALK
ncbi:MAG: hypothetical protein P4M12_02015 [Gammaproteobacteria bacterium]|nr:hypothetical protein [Gammaproteobacteria bacterium]